MSLIKKIFKNVFFNKLQVPNFINAHGGTEEFYREARKVLYDSVRYYEDDIVNRAEKIMSGKSIKSKKIITFDKSSKVTETHEDVDNGTIKLSGVSNVEPKSSDEIIKILKIDTKKWKLSQYWNKQSSDKWYISALVTKLPKEESSLIQIEEQLLKSSISQIKPLKPIKTILKPTNNDKVCGILSFQDLHFGKPGNEDIGKIMNKAIEYLINKGYASYQLEKLVFIIGPDTLNMDTFNGATTKGTPVENSMSPMDTYMDAFESLVTAIGYMKQYCKSLEVIFVPGNHDRLSSFHLVHALSQAFKDWDISFNIKYEERKVINYGNTMLCFEHGDVTAKNNPLVYAVEYPNEWGASKYRILYTGHYHRRKTKEFITENEEHGFITKTIPSLTSTDYWHYHNKYVGNTRSAHLHLHHHQKGMVGEFIYSV